VVLVAPKNAIVDRVDAETQKLYRTEPIRQGVVAGNVGGIRGTVRIALVLSGTAVLVLLYAWSRRRRRVARLAKAGAESGLAAP